MVGIDTHFVGGKYLIAGVLGEPGMGQRKFEK